MVNKHTVDYHPSPLQLTSKIHPLTFLWTPEGFISPESFLLWFSFKHAEVWRFFNLTNKIFTRSYSVQEELHEIYDLPLPYLSTISPTIYQIKSLSVQFFPF